jgi:hypothetical protein
LDDRDAQVTARAWGASVARIAALVSFAVIAAIALFAFIDRGRAGTPRATLVAESPTNNGLFRVTKAPAGSMLRVGDRVGIDDPRTFAAYQLHALAAGSTLLVRRRFPLPEATLAEPIVADPESRSFWLVVVIEAMFLPIAALVAARGRSSASLPLAWSLALIVVLFNPTSPAWPGWLMLTYVLSAGTIAAIAFACAADFASRFAGDPKAAWARRYRRISLAVALGAAALNLGVSCQAAFNPSTPTWLAYAAIAAFAAQALVLLCGLGLAFVKAPGAERQKALWVAAGLGVGIVGFVAAVILNAAGVPEPLRDVPLLLMIAMPAGCAYAILRYRLLDIAFVINRATVFGITSLLVLAALALVDFGLQSLLGSWLLRTGIYVQLGLALAIGIATRPLHGRVDAFVDDLFFRQRHEAERTLRQFVRDVAYISEANVVLQRTVTTVARALRLRCSIFLAVPAGFGRAATSDAAFGAECHERDDPGVVRLLATRAPVDLHDVESGLNGDFAFPMFARDRLLGTLICSGKADGGAAYAPDELEAIGAVAHACALALDLLRIEELERELAALRDPASRPSPVRYVQ